ncbi:hypothetical protein [Ottowia thiooxydans]|uniref:hypothetical protein n=1 Tax=Ottowia thiooxydans TaxID=219182 RepID=UPI00040C5431|nr:hypothetical protein [Ottowia thiooxydans]
MEENTPNERPISPPVETGNSPTRWIVVFFALALLVLGGYEGYRWWSASAERAETATTEPVAEVAPAVPSIASAPAAAPQPVPVQPAQASPPPVTEAGIQAPAVVGTNIINKCQLDGQVTFTNEPCPEGAVAVITPAEATAMDPNGVSGSTGDKASTDIARAPLGGEPSQQEAECRYLAAEITRLNYEFQQSLPPPVLDQIATRLKGTRDRSAGLKCAGAPKEAASKPAPSTRRAASAPASKMLEEKG